MERRHRHSLSAHSTMMLLCPLRICSSVGNNSVMVSTLMMTGRPWIGSGFLSVVGFVVGRTAGWGASSLADGEVAFGMLVTAGCDGIGSGTPTVVGRVSSATALESAVTMATSAGAGSAGVGEDAL